MAAPTAEATCKGLYPRKFRSPPGHRFAAPQCLDRGRFRCARLASVLALPVIHLLPLFPASHESASCVSAPRCLVPLYSTTSSSPSAAWGPPRSWSPRNSSSPSPGAPSFSFRCPCLVRPQGDCRPNRRLGIASCFNTPRLPGSRRLQLGIMGVTRGGCCDLAAQGGTGQGERLAAASPRAKRGLPSVSRRALGIICRFPLQDLCLTCFHCVRRA